MVLKYLLFLKTKGYLIYYPHLYTLFFNIISSFFRKRIIFKNNDLHVLKLLKNVQSEPKLNSYSKFRKKKLYVFFFILYMHIAIIIISFNYFFFTIISAYEKTKKASAASADRVLVNNNFNLFKPENLTTQVSAISRLAITISVNIILEIKIFKKIK